MMFVMRKILITFCIALFPLGAQALDYSDQSLMYLDAPFQPSEAAGISLLTNIRAVQGNPDGTFQPRRTLNRAEFLKIALESHPRILVSRSDEGSCFPDVSEGDWFSKYVCLARKRKIVAGYPDGYFRPENPVNYAEALKILGELYEYTAYADPDAPWYEFYVQAATNHGTILPINLTYDRYLTRGQMARLAAAFRAENEDELKYYRRAERGEYVVVGAEEPDPEPDPGPSPEPDPEPIPEPEEIPIGSHFLVLGKRFPIGDAQLYPQENPVELRIFKVVLEKEARALSGVFLRDTRGTEIAKLKLDIYDRDKETWKIEFDPGESEFVLPGRSDSTAFIIDAHVRKRSERGFSEESVEIKSLYVIVSEVDDPTVQYQIVPSGAHFPAHKTSEARVSNVENLLDGEGELVQGDARHLSSVRIEREANEEADFRVRHLRFWVHKASYISVSDWELRSTESTRRYACSTESTDSLELAIVNCLAIPEELGKVEVFDLYADVDLLDASRGDTLQINMEEPGGLSEFGDIRWTDGSADFQWVELEEPLVEGRVWKY